MKAYFSKSATGNIRSKILDPVYSTAELVIEVKIKPEDFASLVTHYADREFNIAITPTAKPAVGQYEDQPHT